MKSPIYIRLHAGFTEWLRILNFEPTSQRDMPKMLEEFLSYLESRNCSTITDIKEKYLTDYRTYLDHRKNRKWEGGLSKNYIRKHMQVIRKFTRYLSESGQESFMARLRIKGKSSFTKTILTVEEVRKLYDVITNDMIGLRDKALLAIYYGCGLRKNEGVNLNTGDVYLDKGILFVRKGKGYKERYVPLSDQGKDDLTNYLLYARSYMLTNLKEEALLLTMRGTRLSGAMCYERIQKLKELAGITIPVGLHTLRHSIASHLLHSGMKLEQIQRFLGHSSLESTQIYTHIIHESSHEFI